MLVVVHRDGLVDQQDRDVVVDAVLAMQPRVVETPIDVEKRTPVFGAHEQLEQCGIERHPVRPGIGKIVSLGSWIIGLPGPQLGPIGACTMPGVAGGGTAGCCT